MRIADPYRLELEYTRELFAGLLFQPRPKAFTMIGLGAASATKFAWKQFPRARVTSVEIDQNVINCAHAHFALPPDSSRLRSVCADGEAWIGRHAQSCDYLVVDAYDAAARGPVLSSPAFYAACRAALPIDEIGVMAVNLFGKHASFQQNIRAIFRAFDGRMLVLPASERGNVVAFGFAGPEAEFALGALRRQAAALRERTGLEFSRWLAGFKRANAIDGPTLSP